MENKETDIINESKTIDVRRLSAPLVTMISVLSFVIWGTMTLLNEKQRIYDGLEGQILELKEFHRNELRQVSELMYEVKINLEMTREKQKQIIDHMWTKNDQISWCFLFQSQNKTVKCPDITYLKNFYLFDHEMRQTKKVQEENIQQTD